MAQQHIFCQIHVSGAFCDRMAGARYDAWRHCFDNRSDPLKAKFNVYLERQRNAIAEHYSQNPGADLRPSPYFDADEGVEKDLRPPDVQCCAAAGGV